MKIPYVMLLLLLAALNTIGPFSVDTYLPAFPAIEAGLHATPLELQQSLTAYLLPFSFMMLWHGAISDAVGRKRVIIVGQAVFVLASLLCATAPNIELFWLGRILQGLSAGAGVIVGRAVIRDLFDGIAAQRLMSHVTMVFAVSPAIAPILGGWLATALSWRAIFYMLCVIALLLIAMTWKWLPETLPAAKRQSLHPTHLLAGYKSILGSLPFIMLCLSMALFFSGFFIYVMSAPVFLIDHLGLTETQFGYLFVPIVTGMILGSAVSARLAGRLHAAGTITLAYGIAAAAMLINLALNYALADSVATRIPQITLYTFGMSVALPTLTLRALDMFPHRRGMAASCQGFIQTLIMSAVAGVVSPLLWDSTRHLAWGMVVGLMASLAAYLVSLRTYRVID
ncbi:multidrug effflux MFS transporter [Uliginosibacterium sp. H3]|uniref:Bcr/CflA family efflux transporter n=1 Tax=Uliginosibacterium silvisoli TaxID=3114758 RepID=A0ABU6K1W1_9RHOO|nr:multidrug effflux MFS transporter [Uliginosibacterium sp. H3]